MQSQKLLLLDSDFKQKSFGINDNFNYGVGGQNYHYKKNGLTVENILNYIIKKFI